MNRTVAGILAALVMQPGLLHAQQGERSARWGVISSMTPRWTAASQLADYVKADAYDISGSEFSIGVVRGRDYSGDYGVSFVWKGISQGSASRFGTKEVCDRGTCVEDSTTVVAKNASMLGVEAHAFFSLIRLGRRAHIGVGAAAGVLRVRGRAERSERYGGFDFDPSTGLVNFAQRTEVLEVPGGQVFTLGKDVQNVPSGKIEIGLGLVLTRSLKARVSGGFDFPGYHVASVKLVYLFGRPGPESIFH